MPRVPNACGHSAARRRAVGLIPRAGWCAQGLASPGHRAAQRVGVRVTLSAQSGEPAAEGAAQVPSDADAVVFLGGLRDVAAADEADAIELAAFQAAPLKHRAHAARSLVVYHMLEHRRRPRQALVDWVATTPIFLKALQCGDSAERAQQGAETTVARLLADGVLQSLREDGVDLVQMAGD